jgi:phosphoglycerate kinase
MRAELETLGAALEHPEHPVLALIGGAKVSTKLNLLEFMIGKVDMLAIGGAMANTFLHAQGKPVGRSLCAPDLADTARAIPAKAETHGCRIILPEDVITAEKLETGVVPHAVSINAVPINAMILDIGPNSVCPHRRSARSIKDAGVERPGRCVRGAAL